LRSPLGERESISRGRAEHRSLAPIVAELGRSISTVRREVLRNGGSSGYRAVQTNVSYPLEHAGRDCGK
jgi:IS30 family transposase